MVRWTCWQFLIAVLLASVWAGCERDKAQTPTGATIESVSEVKRQAMQVSHRRTKSKRRNAIGADSRGTSAGRSTEAALFAEAKGTVTLPDGSPAADASVTLWTRDADAATSLPWHRIAVTRTDAKGRYKLLAQRKERIGITIRKSGFAIAALQDRRRLLNADQKVRTFTPHVQLEPAVTIKGIVNSASIADGPANIMLHPHGMDDLAVMELNVYSNSAGAFEIQDVPRRTGRVVAVAPERTRYQGEYDPTELIEVKRMQSVSSAVGRLKLVEGSFDFSENPVVMRFKNTYSELPYTVAYANVTDEKTFTIPAMERTFYNIAFLCGRGSLYLESARNVFRPAGEEEQVIPVVAGSTVSGIVVDADTSAALANVRVYRDDDEIASEDNEAVTSITGEFRIDGVRHFEDIAVESITHVKIAFNADSRYPADTTAPVQILMKRANFFRGYVTSTYGSVPANLSVGYFEGGRLNSPTFIKVEADGSFACPALTGRSYRIVAEAPGYPPVFTDTLIMQSEDINGVVLTLGEGQQIHGEVVSRKGHAVANTRLSVHLVNVDKIANPVVYRNEGSYNPGIIMAETRADKSGRFALNDISGQVPAILLAVHDDYPYTSSYPIEPGKEVSPVTIVMDECTSAMLYVTDKENVPLSGVTLQLEHRIGPSLHVHTDQHEVNESCQLSRLPLETTSTMLLFKHGYEAHYADVRFTSDPVHIQLKKSDTAPVTVRCVDAVTNQPVETKLAQMIPDLKLNPVEGQPGIFQCEDAVIGTEYFLAFRGDGYGPTGTSVFTPVADSDKDIIVLMQKSGTMLGRAVDGSTGEPIAGAGIYLKWQDKPTTITDSNGYFSLNWSDRHSNFRIKDGDARRSAEREIPKFSSTDLDLGDIPLYVKVPATVLVLDHEGVPLQDINLLVGLDDYTGKGIVQGRTDKRGKFRLMTYSDDSLFAAIMKPGFKYREGDGYTDAVLQNQTVSPSGSSTAERIIVLTREPGEISGRLIYKQLPRIGDVTLVSIDTFSKRAQAGSVKTNADGRFHFDNLQPGNYKLIAEVNNGQEQLGVTVPVSVTVEQRSVIQDIILKPKDRALGVFVKNEKGESVSGAKVVVSKPSGDQANGTTTNRSGYGGIWLRDPGKYRVSAGHPLHGNSESKEVLIEDDKPLLQVHLQLKTYESQIVCSVLSYLDGLPVASAVGSLIAEDGGVIGKTVGSSSGEVVFENIAPGKYKMVINATGFSEATREVSVAAGEKLEVSEVLVPGKFAFINVTDGRGYGMQGAVVTLGTTGETLTTDRRGSVSFHNVSAEVHTGIVVAPTGERKSFTLDARYPSHSSLEIQFGL